MSFLQWLLKLSFTLTQGKKITLHCGLLITSMFNYCTEDEAGSGLWDREKGSASDEDIT